MEEETTKMTVEMGKKEAHETSRDENCMKGHFKINAWLQQAGKITEKMEAVSEETI